MTDEELKLLAKKELVAYVKGETPALCPASQNYWKEHIEKTLNRIAELEATLTEQKQYTAFKCAQAKEKIEALEKEKCELLGIIQGKDKAIFVLKKENAELKERFERAKEIIKDFVDRDDSCWLIQKKAEEFLKECE